MTNTEISFVDVKQVYDAAYAELEKLAVNLERFTALIAEATKLDQAYRAQLATTSAFSYARAAA